MRSNEKVSNKFGLGPYRYFIREIEAKSMATFLAAHPKLAGINMRANERQKGQFVRREPNVPPRKICPKHAAIWE